MLPFGREPDAGHGPQGRVGLVLRAAATQALPDEVLAPIRSALGLNAPGVLAYQDAKRGQQRALRIARDATGTERLSAFWVAGDASGEAWLRALLEADQTLPGPGRALLAPGALAGKSATPRSPQVCTCFNVSEDAIRAELQTCPGNTGERLAHLQATLKCGTNCGSCLPALRNLAKTVGAEAPLSG